VSEAADPSGVSHLSERTQLHLALRAAGRHAASPQHRMVLFSILLYRSHNAAAWPGLEAIKDDTGILSTVSLQETLNQLKAAGAIHWRQRSKGTGNYSSNEYVLTWRTANWERLKDFRRKGLTKEEQVARARKKKPDDSPKKLKKLKPSKRCAKPSVDHPMVHGGASTVDHSMPYDRRSLNGVRRRSSNDLQNNQGECPPVSGLGKDVSTSGGSGDPDPEPSRRDSASTPPASQDSLSEPALARRSSASPTEGESSVREARSFVTSGQSSGLGGSSESPSNEPADPSNQPSFWGDPEPTSTPCGQSSPSGSGQSSPVPTSQPSVRPLITDIAGWKRLVHAQGGRDPIIAFTSDQLRTLAYLDVQDEAYWIWRHKQPDWHITYGTDATWETPEGHPYPPRFPVQAIHFEIAEQKGLSLLQQLIKLRILDPPCRKSWEIALAHHLLTEKTYREQSDADERDFMDSNAPPDVLKERSTVVAGYLEAKKHRRWPEYALQGRSKDDLWALRAKETASLTRAAQRVSNGRIDRVA